MGEEYSGIYALECRVDSESPQFLCEIKGNVVDEAEFKYTPIMFGCGNIYFSVKELKPKRQLIGAAKIDLRKLYEDLTVT
jgi:hypothetical protein